MKKILISIDHKWRDLPGYVYLGLLLEQNGFKVEFCRNGLEKFYIQGFKPNILIVNHLLDKRRQKYFNKIKKEGVKVVVLPTEGIPTLEKYRKFAAELNSDLSSVELYLTWNEPMKNILINNPTIKNNKIKVVGVPRFDFYKKPLKKLLKSKKDFVKKYNLKEELPIVTFATNFTQAQFAEKNKDFYLNDAQNLGYLKVIQEIQEKFGLSIPELDYISREFNLRAFIQLVKDFPNVNFILKLHPSEDHLYYYNLINKQLNDVNNFAIVVKEYIWDVLSITDIELKRSCTTGVESWILNIPTIELQLSPKEWYFSKEHASGSNIVTNYNELKKMILYYLNNGKISDALLEKRINFLKKWCYKVDGMSTKRVVDNIKQIETQETNIKVNFKDLFIYYLLKISNLKIHDYKVYGFFSLKQVDKLGRMDKYYHLSDIKKWKRKILKVFKCKL